MTGFSAFSKSAVQFLQGLEANNSRDWFEANKKVYESEIKKPAALLADELQEGLSARCGIVMAGKVFRLHRDVRFSKDKTPYNAYVRMGFFEAKPSGLNVGFFLSFEPRQIVLGAGAMEFDKAQLQRYRTYVSGVAGESVEKTLAKLTQKGIDIRPPELKRVPAGFEGGDLLLRKSLTGWKTEKGHELLTGAKSAPNVLKAWAAFRPLYDILKKI